MKNPSALPIKASACEAPSSLQAPSSFALGGSGHSLPSLPSLPPRSPFLSELVFLHEPGLALQRCYPSWVPIPCPMGGESEFSQTVELSKCAGTLQAPHESQPQYPKNPPQFSACIPYHTQPRYSVGPGPLKHENKSLVTCLLDSLSQP